MKFFSIQLILSILSVLLVIAKARPYDSQIYYLVDTPDDLLSLIPGNTMAKRAVKREKIVMDSLGGDYLVRKRNYL